LHRIDFAVLVLSDVLPELVDTLFSTAFVTHTYL